MNGGAWTVARVGPRRSRTVDSSTILSPDTSSVPRALRAALVHPLTAAYSSMRWIVSSSAGFHGFMVPLISRTGPAARNANHPISRSSASGNAAQSIPGMLTESVPACGAPVMIAFFAIGL